MVKEFISKIEMLDSNLWGNHIKVPQEIANFYKENKIKRLICWLQEEIKMHCAIMYNQEGPFILINKSIYKQLKKIGNDIVKVRLEEDLSKYGMDMPIEFEQCLIEDQKAYEHFENLTPGKQRNLIHLVASVKSSDIKIRRALAILEHLKREQGKIDFKGLNHLIKEYNQNFKL